MVVSQLAPLNLQQNERLQALYHLAVELSALRSLESILETTLCHCVEDSAGAWRNRVIR